MITHVVSIVSKFVSQRIRRTTGRFAVGLLAVLAFHAQAANPLWNGAGSVTNNNFGNTNNWVAGTALTGNSINGLPVNFDALASGAANTANCDSSGNSQTWTFNAGAPNMVVTMNSQQLGAATGPDVFINNSPNLQTIKGSFALFDIGGTTASRRFNANSGPMTITNGAISFRGDAAPATWALELAGSSNGILSSTFANVSAGTVNILKSGTGTWEAFSAFPNLAGTSALTVSGGTLQLDGVNTFSGGTTIATGTTLKIAGSGSLGSGTYAAAVADTGVLNFNSSANQIFSGAFTASAGGGNLTQSGSGTVTLSGTADNSYLNATVSSGTLTLGKTSSAGVHALGGTATASTGGTLKLGGTGGDQIYSGASVAMAGGTFDMAGLTEGFNVLSGFGTISDSVGGGSLTPTGNTSFSGGTLTLASGTLNLNGAPSTGVAGGGTYNQTGGTNNTGTYFASTAGAGTGNVNLSGGVFNNNAELLMGFSSPGNLTVSGTAALNVNFLSWGDGTLNTVNMNLNGGTIWLHKFNNRGSSTNTLTFNGSTLRALSSQAAWLAAAGNLIARISTNGFILDSQSFNVTNSASLLHDPGLGATADGGVNKSAGAGSLTLSGMNTYTGNTVISVGPLALSGGGSLTSPNIIIAGGATFDVSGLSSTFALASGQTVSNSTSTATLAGNASSGSGTISLKFASGTPALSVTNGTLTLSGSTVFKVNNTGAALAVGSYKIISKLTGGLVAGTLPSVTVSGGGLAAGTSASLLVSGGELYLQVQNITATTLTRISGGNPATYGDTLTFQATISPAPATVGETISFLDGVTVIGTATNDASGVAVFSTGALTVSSHSITATYPGDAINLASTSSALLQTNIPALLGITANNAAKTYDGLGFTGGNGVTYSGFVNGETSAVLGGTLSYGVTSQNATNAGSYTIIPSGQTSANYAISYTNGTLTINPLGVTVTANGQTKAYGASDPALTYSSTPALVSGDSFSGALSRVTGESVGSYAITQGSLSLSANYTLTYNGTNLVITPAGTSVGVASSANPSGYLGSVYFTATLPTNATGNVFFSSPSGPISTNSLSSGAATSSAIASLPRGTNVISFAYLGDGNYVGSTNTLDQIVTNHPPVANSASYTRNAASQQIKIAVTNLLGNATDVDGDTLTLVSVSASTNAAILILSGGLVMYYNTNAVADEFTYTVTDGFGGTNSATVTIYVDSTPLFGQVTIPAVDTTGGTATLNFAGIPTYNYSVLRSTNLTSWAVIWTTNAPGSGVFQYIDTSAPQPSAYYRLQYNP